MISFSGIDCSGKSTQINLLCEKYKKNNIKYRVVWSRGGYTPGIEFVKKLLRKGRATKESNVAESNKVNENPKKRKLLFVAGLIDLWFTYSILLRLMECFGIHIICDRYIWDTYIDYKLKYPEYDFENGFWWRLTLRTMLKPNPSFVLFIPADESMRRSEQKEEPFPEEIEVREKRIEMYVAQVQKDRWHHKIDATKSIQEVFSQIEECISWKN